MTDLRPFREEGADSELAELFAAGRPAKPLDDVVLERSRRRVRALERPRRRAGVFGSLPAAAGVFVWVQHAALGAGLGIVVAAAAAAPRLIRHFSSDTPPMASVRAPPTAPRPLPSAPPVPANVPPAAEERSSPALPPSSAVGAYPESSAKGDNLELELLLVERAKAELRRDPETAFRTLLTHRTDFANGKLALEREFLMVVALVRLGRLAEARAHADSLRARAPGNLYDERLRQLLGDPVRSP